VSEHTLVLLALVAPVWTAQHLLITRRLNAKRDELIEIRRKQREEGYHMTAEETHTNNVELVIAFLNVALMLAWLVAANRIASLVS